MMGSPTITVKPIHAMAEKKSIKSNIKNTIISIFSKDKKKNKIKNDKNTSTQEKVEIKETLNDENKNNVNKVNHTVNKINNDFNKIHDDSSKIKKDETNKINEYINHNKGDNETVDKREDETSSLSDDDDELKNFCIKVIREVERNRSESSQDSGLPDSLKNYEDDVIGTFEKLEIKENVEEKEDADITKQFQGLNLKSENCDQKELDDKKKKVQTVFVSRGPDRNKVSKVPSALPYSRNDYQSLCLNQISQINRESLSGGQVIVNVEKQADNLSDLTDALDKIDKGVQGFTKISHEERTDFWEVAAEYISEQSGRNDTKINERIPKFNEEIEKETILEGFAIDPQLDYHVDQYVPNNMVSETTNPVEEFSTAHETYISNQMTYDDTLIFNNGGIFPTPPRSENVPSPNSPTYSTPSDYSSMFSPDLSSPVCNSDMEKYQEFVETPAMENQQFMRLQMEKSQSETPQVEKQKKERKTSSSTMTLKQYKDLQKEIAAELSKKPCCRTRRSTKEVFVEYMDQLTDGERKALMVNTSMMDLKDAESVLNSIVRSPPDESSKKSGIFATFYLICGRVLAQKPEHLLGELGYTLLKFAVLRWHKYPVLTQYLVECIRIALRSDPTRNPEEPLFNETDSNGDNLILGCARAGDACADVLSLLLAEDGPRLFHAAHYNTEGYTALHVACASHSTASPKIHIVHVLLTHANMDIWQEDKKGGDTAVHFAVNSANCDLRLVMVLFSHLERTQWKRLAHVPNRSSVTPLEYARAATKSAARQNYPPEILEFLKKCR